MWVFMNWLVLSLFVLGAVFLSIGDNKAANLCWAVCEGWAAGAAGLAAGAAYVEIKSGNS